MERFWPRWHHMVSLGGKELTVNYACGIVLWTINYCTMTSVCSTVYYHIIIASSPTLNWGKWQSWGGGKIWRPPIQYRTQPGGFSPTQGEWIPSLHHHWGRHPAEKFAKSKGSTSLIAQGDSSPVELQSLWDGCTRMWLHRQSHSPEYTHLLTNHHSHLGTWRERKMWWNSTAFSAARTLHSPHCPMWGPRNYSLFRCHWYPAEKDTNWHYPDILPS